MESISYASINWGSVADWVSGTGSLAAAVVALYIARFSQRVRLRGYCGHRIIVGLGQTKIDVFTVSVTNISQRPTMVTNIGFTCEIWRWKRYGIIGFTQDDISHGIPKALSDGESGNWNVRMGESNQWARDIINKFEMTRISRGNIESSNTYVKWWHYRATA